MEKKMKLQILKQNLPFPPKRKKRSLAALAGIAGAAAFLCSGCTKQTKTMADQSDSTASSAVEYTCIANPDSEKSIYVILKNYHGAYWEKVIDGVAEAAEEIDAAVYLGGIDNETDIINQVELMNEAIEEGADGILLAPASSDELVDSCKTARENDISVVLIDSLINSSEFDACYMTDNLEAGQLAAEGMLDMLKEAGNSASEPLEVGIVLSSDTSQAMVNRVSGFLDYWAEHAPVQWEVAQDIYLNGGNVKKAQSNVETLLEEHEAIKGIFGCNNTSTIGISNALLKGKRTDVVMVGFDLADETKQLIESEDYRAVSLLQKQDQMGYLGILSLDSMIKGEESKQKYFDTGVELIDAEYLMEKDVS